MRGAIAQFMWGFQPHFRMSVERAAKGALKTAGADVYPEALLIGFRANADADWDVCVEPEWGRYAQQGLDDVPALGAELYDADPESQIFNTDPGIHEQFHRRLRNTCRARALEQTLAEQHPDRLFVAGLGNRVGNYHVHPVISVDRENWERLPTLGTTWRYRMTIYPSLQAAIVARVLREAALALSLQEPPVGLVSEFDLTDDDVRRDASESLVESVVYLTGELFASALKTGLDALAAQPYEGRSGAGSIVIAARDHPALDVVVRLDNPVSVTQTRAMRKLLEMSSDDLELLTDGQAAYGLGKVSDEYDPSTEEIFVVTVLGRGSWTLAHGELPLLAVDNVVATLPSALVSEERFRDIAERLFPDASLDLDALWGMVLAATEQAHGTMLVVHANAADEAARLAPQAIAIEATAVTKGMLKALTSIDGAVLLSPDGACHALGVILDGLATGTGDPSRGARFNSAVRYLAGASDPCLIIIVSEDGMINLMPDLRPRISREAVAGRLDAVRAAAMVDEPDFEVFHKAFDRLEEVAFYLNEEQCAEANVLRERVEDFRESRGMRIHHRPLAPDVGMNDTYFL